MNGLRPGKRKGRSTMAQKNPKSDPLTQDPMIRQCFDSLPPYVQETVKQSGVEITSREQLQQCANHLLKK